MALTARYTRTSILEVGRADFIRTARAKGLSDNQVLRRHVLRNALIPLVTILAPQIPNLITGTIFIESIFRVPGLGQFFRHQHPEPRLSHDHGHPAAGGSALVIHLSVDRHSLHHHRPARAAGTGSRMSTTTLSTQPAASDKVIKPRSLLGDAARRFMRNRLAIVGGLIVGGANLYRPLCRFILAPYRL
jgi:hypothetical protein